MYDVMYAWRALMHRPGITALAILCLAIGIGANTALFGVLDTLLFKPPAGVSGPDELVRLNVGDIRYAAALSAGQSVSYPTYRDARGRMSLVAHVAAYAPRGLTLGSGENAERLEAVIGSGNYFAVLGVRPEVGRLFDETDAANGSPLVAVLGYGAWQRRYGGSTDALGSTIHVNGVPVTVIGVAARGFVGVDLGEPDLWLPMGVTVREEFGGPRNQTDRVFWLQMLARRNPGVSVATLDRVASASDRADRTTPVTPLHATALRPMFFAEQRGRNPIPVWSLGITLTVLLLACATVANVLLAQGVAREREIAVRLAIGAPRRRILRQLLIENGMIALAAAIAATVLASWSAALLRVLPAPPIDRLVDLRVAAFAFVVALCTTVVFGLAPALWTARGDLDAVLRRAGHAAARSSRIQHALMVTQIALSFILLVGAGLFMASFRNVRRIDTGFPMDRLLTASFDIGTLPASEAATFMERAVAHVERVPGVEAVGLGRVIPFYLYARYSFWIADGRTDDEQPGGPVMITPVTAEWFDAMGIGSVSGRLFDERDRSGSTAVALVSEALAREYWPDRSPLGACLEFDRPAVAECVSVVGVVQDVRLRDLRGDPTQIIYVPAQQSTELPATTMFVRTTGAAEALAEQVHRVVQRVDDRVPFVQVVTLDARARPQRIPWEVAATLFTAFGSLATLLAGIGLYMVVAFVVRQRTRELGIRIAIGATPGVILRLVLDRALRLTAGGIAIGAVAALALGRLLAHKLYGVSASDTGSFAGAAFLLTTVAILAACRPALQASRVDPVAALRDE